MALGESLTGVSLLHAMDTVRGVTGTVTESEAGVCLALLVQGKCAWVSVLFHSSG